MSGPNTALTITKPMDSLRETKKPHSKPLNINYRWKNIFMCLKF